MSSRLSEAMSLKYIVVMFTQCTDCLSSFKKQRVHINRAVVGVKVGKI